MSMVMIMLIEKVSVMMTVMVTIWSCSCVGNDGGDSDDGCAGEVSEAVVHILILMLMVMIFVMVKVRWR